MLSNLCVLHVGIDYAAQDFWNTQIEVDYLTGEIGDKEYKREHWRDKDLEPMMGGRVFVPRMAGNWYVHRRSV